MLFYPGHEHPFDTTFDLNNTRYKNLSRFLNTFSGKADNLWDIFFFVPIQVSKESP
jgi:hypothetical protein